MGILLKREKPKYLQPDEQRTQDYITGDLDKMSEHISSQFENDILQINVNLTKMVAFVKII